MHFSPLLSLLIASSLLGASEEQFVTKANAASAALLQKLGGEVKKNMETSGPVKTVEYCANNALLLTDQVARETDTSIRRLTLKERNPLNRATGEEKALLEQWEQTLKNGRNLPPYEVKKLPNGKTAYYKPLLINNEACLKCHGDVAADSPLATAIRATYPEDKAMGYKMGDLRGMIKVEPAGEQ